MNAHTSAGADSAATTIAPAAGRAMISALFLLSGVSKVTAPAMTIGYIQSVGLPAPTIALALSATVELVGGLALLLGFRTRITAGILFLFTLATAAIFHTHLADQTSSFTSSRTSRSRAACSTSSPSAAAASASTAGAPDGLAPLSQRGSVMLTLHAFATPNSLKPVIAHEELGLPYDLQSVDLRRGEQRNDVFQATNPNGKVPVLVDDAFVLGEPAAILVYLAEKTGQLMPTEATARANQPCLPASLSRGHPARA